MKKNVLGLLICLFSMGYPATAQQKVENQLSAKEISIISISALTAKGDLDKIKPELVSGLENGLTVNEIKEVFIHLYAYSGFPRSLRGLQTFMVVIQERKESGIKDVQGAEASPIDDDRSKYDRGKEILEELVGRPLDGPRTGYAAFAPTIEIFLKEHLFADIFERDILTYAQRELVTISVLSTLGGLEPMLNSHFKICLNVGITPEQLQEFVNVIDSKVGQAESNAAKSVLDMVLEDDNSDN